MCKPDRPDRAAFFPPIIHGDHPVRVFGHVAVSVGIDAGVVFLLHDDNIRTCLQHFIGPPFFHQIIQALLVGDNCNQFQRRIFLFLFQYNLGKILVHAFRKPAHKPGKPFFDRKYAPKVVGYDFPQDYAIREHRFMKPGDPYTPQPVHEHVLKQGEILQIEYMTNLWEIGTPTCQLIALLLNTKQADGSQIRLIAVVEE